MGQHTYLRILPPKAPRRDPENIFFPDQIANMFTKHFFATSSLLASLVSAVTNYNTTTPVFDLEDLTLREVGARDTLVRHPLKYISHNVLMLGFVGLENMARKGWKSNFLLARRSSVPQPIQPPNRQFCR